jgi:hypothetical protein
MVVKLGIGVTLPLPPFENAVAAEMNVGETVAPVVADADWCSVALVTLTVVVPSALGRCG